MQRRWKRCSGRTESGFFVLLVAAEAAVLGRLADFGVIEDFDGEGEGRMAFPSQHKVGAPLRAGTVR